jgi:hypothetical protein
VVSETNRKQYQQQFPFSGLMNFDEPAARRGNYNDYILKKGRIFNDKINRNIFIRVDASKTSCYVGEPIMVNL